MATRSVTFTFINEDGLERTRTMIQDVPNFVQDPPPPPPPDPIEPKPDPVDIFLDNPIQLPIVPLDFSDIEIDLSNLDFGLGDIKPIGPIFTWWWDNNTRMEQW